MTDGTKTADLLDKAADVLETRGWHQGGFVAGDPTTSCLCVAGAINVAAGLRPNGPHLNSFEERAAQRALDARKRLRNWVGGNVIEWNDADGRTAEQVITALREAAAAERVRTDA